MKFTVEIKEFWLDEEHELEPRLKEFVIRSVVNQINDSIKKKVEDAIALEVKSQVEQSLYRRIQELVKQVVNGETLNVSVSYNKYQQMTIAEFVKHSFEHNSGYASPKDQIKNLAKQFGSELKQRYDLLFASQIVAKLNENGLLKEDAAKMLMQTIDKGATGKEAQS